MVSSARRVSRRQVLELGAGAVVVGVLGVEVAQHVMGAGAPAPTSDSTHAASGRVLRVDGDVVEVQTFLSSWRRSATIAGFPESVSPRVGDHVTLTDLVDGHEMAALPVCRWVAGVPKLLADQTISVGGQRLVASPALVEAGQRKTAVTACILDSSLGTCQVLAVRG